MKSRTTRLILFLILFPLLLLPEGKATADPLPWPIREPFVIGAQFSDFQNYSGVSYLHGGIDLVGSAGMAVYSPATGVVEISRYRIDAGRDPRRFAYERTPFTPGLSTSEYAARYIEIAVTDAEKRRWMFRHLDGTSISPELLEAARTGRLVPAGTRLGTLIPWSESIYPEKRRYDHLHLEITDPAGVYLNPATVMMPRADPSSPVIADIFLTPNEAPGVISPPADQPPIVSGTIDLLARIEDRCTGADYVHSPFRVDLAFESMNGTRSATLSSHTVFLFDRLPITGDRTQSAEVLYRETFETPSGTIHSVGDNQLRRSWLCLTNGDVRHGYAGENGVDTTAFSDGVYAFVITASDLAGNSATKRQVIRIRNRGAAGSY